MKVTIADGKYTVVCDEVKGLRALRYGEEWRDLTGDNLVAELALEIEELRAAMKVKGKTMDINIIDKDTVSVGGDLFKRVDVEEILIFTLDGYQYFLGPEYDGVLDWYAAKHWCESLGEGYELPNRLVMLAICMNKETAALFTEYEYYWTSSEFNDYAPRAWAQYWHPNYPGNQYDVSKSHMHRVRAVWRRYIEGQS